MERKDLKFYEAPACEVVESNVQAPLLAGSIPDGDTERAPGMVTEED